MTTYLEVPVWNLKLQLIPNPFCRQTQTPSVLSAAEPALNSQLLNFAEAVT